MYHIRKLFILMVGLITCLVTFLSPGRAAAAATLIVPDNYSTIQAAINAASPGDTIIVRPGTYYENVNLNKSVTLTAEVFDPNDPTHNTTVIDGGPSSSIGSITIPSGVTPMPTIRGFVIRNGYDAIKTSSQVTIEYNFFIAATDQIDYSKGSGGINRNNVYFVSGDDAIDLDDMVHSILIENNRLLYSGNDGIEMRLQDASAPAQPITVTIRNNQIIGCDEDGIQIIDYSQTLDTNRRIHIHNNLIANSQQAGIGLMPNATTTEDYSGADIIEAIRVYNNTFYGNDYGISGGDNLVAFNNLITSSAAKGVWRVQGPAGANSVAAYTLFYNNGLDADQSTLGAGNLFGQNPRFAYLPGPGPDNRWGTVDDDFGGLVPLAGSPVIDAGVTQYIAGNGEAVPSTPIAGFSGTGPDLGWKESGSLPPPSATPTSSPVPTSTPPGFGMVTSRVNSSADDAEEQATTGTMDLGSTDLELGADGSTAQWVGLRFNNISIPRGTTILNAYIEFEVDETGFDPTSVTFQGQAADTASTFTTAKNNVSGRERTTAQVAWNFVPAWPVVDVKWQTPDLAPIVQEIVNRAGWTSGNSLAILVSGTGERTAEAYNGEASAAPLLVIQYTTSSSTQTPTPIHTPTITPTPTQTPTGTPTLTPVPADSVRFAVISDYGTGGQSEQDVAALVKSWSPDFIITSGDNNTPLGEAATIDKNIGQFYHQYIYPYIGSYGAGAAVNRFFPALGNHDWEMGNVQPYLDYFALPGNERYYDFVWGPVHFFAIDSDNHEVDGNQSTSIQAVWLRDQLASSVSPWNVVYFHHPPYTSGAVHGSTAGMRWPFEAWGADAVFSGHNHTYERVILNSFPYFVNGLGGQSIYAFTTPVAGSEVRYNGDYGAMLVEADTSHMTFQFITRTGLVIDTYTLDSSVTPTASAIPTFTATGTQTPAQPLTPTSTQTSTATASPSSIPVATYTSTPTRTPTSTNTPTAAFTPTSTRTATPTATSTPTRTGTPTATPSSASSPDLIFSDGFESAGLSAWSSNVNDGGDLSAAAAAKLLGSFGMQAVIDDNNGIYVTDSSPSAEARYRTRFYFDPNSISMGNNNAHYIFYGYSGTSTVVLQVELRYSKAAYQLRASVRNDSSTWTSSSWITISDAPHAIEMDWRAATAMGANNGSLTFWIDGAQLASLTGVDNDTRRIDSIRLGATSGIDSGTRGVYYFDAFESHRQSYIGP